MHKIETTPEGFYFYALHMSTYCLCTFQTQNTQLKKQNQKQKTKTETIQNDVDNIQEKTNLEYWKYRERRNLENTS